MTPPIEAIVIISTSIFIGIIIIVAIFMHDTRKEAERTLSEVRIELAKAKKEGDKYKNLYTNLCDRLTSLPLQ